MNKLIITTAMLGAMIAPALAYQAPDNFYAGDVCYSRTGEVLNTGGTRMECTGDQEEFLRQERIRVAYPDQADILIAMPEFDTLNHDRYSDGHVVDVEALWARQTSPYSGINSASTPTPEDQIRLSEIRARWAREAEARVRATFTPVDREARSARYNRLMAECLSAPSDSRVQEIQQYAAPGAHGSEYATLTQEQFVEIFDACEAGH